MMMLALVLQSVRGVVLPLLVVGFSVIWTMGAMALLDIPIYPHLAAHVSPKAFSNNTPEHIYRQLTGMTMMTAGKAMLFNALEVICGFFVPLLSNFPPTRTMGILVSLNSSPGRGRHPLFGARWLLPVWNSACCFSRLTRCSCETISLLLIPTRYAGWGTCRNRRAPSTTPMHSPPALAHG